MLFWVKLKQIDGRFSADLDGFIPGLTEVYKNGSKRCRNMARSVSPSRRVIENKHSTELGA